MLLIDFADFFIKRKRYQETSESRETCSHVFLGVSQTEDFLKSDDNNCEANR